ncbi:MAG: hypothetical protein U0X58_12975 [Flavobacteriaceae bacterium]
MKKLTVLFIMALGIFASCVPYPEENPDPIPPASTMFLKKIIETDLAGTTYQEDYTYSGSKIVSSLNSDGESTVFTYNDLDQIIKTEVFTGATPTLKETNNYVYDISENLISLVKINATTLTGTKWVYVHNANGTISYQKFTGNDVDQTELVATGELSATKVVETITDPVTTEVTINTSTFTYDSRNSPFMNVTGFDKIYFAESELPLNFKNNVISEVYQVNDEASTLEYNNEYTYTNNHFPNKMSTKQAGVIVAETNYFY